MYKTKDEEGNGRIKTLKRGKARQLYMIQALHDPTFNTNMMQIGVQHNQNSLAYDR